MPSLEVATATVDAFHPEYIPVGVFVGGTSGVGEAMLKRLGQSLNGNIHLIIVGRNKAAAERTFASLPKSSRGASVLREFVHCDATLMANIEVASDSIKQLVNDAAGGKIHFLVNSAGYATFLPVDPTKDGLDDQMVMRYYGRWKFIDELLPLLQKARDAGEPARVMSVLAGGHLFKGTLNVDDMGLKKTWTWTRSFKNLLWSSAYNDMMIEEFSLRNPGIAFTHIHPGVVDTPALETVYGHWIWRLLWPLVMVAHYFLLVTPEQCSQWMLHALLDRKEGFFSCGSNGDDVAHGKFMRQSTEVTRKALWDHTREVTRSRTSN